MKILKLAAAVIVVFLVVAQAFRIDKSNPPVESDVTRISIFQVYY